MSKEYYRINITEWRNEVTKDWNPDERHENQDYIDNSLTLLDALERCYEEIDTLRESINTTHQVMLKYADREY